MAAYSKRKSEIIKALLESIAPNLVLQCGAQRFVLIVAADGGLYVHGNEVTEPHELLAMLDKLTKDIKAQMKRGAN